MCDAAPGIIYMFDRMGVMFNRTPEGLLISVVLVEHNTTVPLFWCNHRSTTSLRVRRTSSSLGSKWTSNEIRTLGILVHLLLMMKDVCRGIVAQDLRSMEDSIFPCRCSYSWRPVVLGSFLENPPTP